VKASAITTIRNGGRCLRDGGEIGEDGSNIVKECGNEKDRQRRKKTSTLRDGEMVNQ